MSGKKILSVEVPLAPDNVEYVHFSSKRSLLDYDIIIFRPDISEFVSYAEQYNGKASLSEDRSFKLKEHCLHWAREIKQAYENGKTIVIYLTPLEEIYVDTGKKTYSGTGRNRHTTRHVEPYNNYNAIPVSVGPVATNGSAIKLTSKGAEVLAPYWAEFEKNSQYEVLLTDPKVPPCLLTRTGDRPVGALLRSPLHSGTVLLLPNLDFDNDDFSLFAEDGEEYWSEEGRQFGERFVSAIVALDKALRKGSEVTPEPGWATDAQFTLNVEAELRNKLIETERKVQQAQAEKEDVLGQLTSAGRHRSLLFEKGKALEAAIISALHVMGFVAAPFKQSDSEFDVVFSCEAGRLIGEAEGKDNKAINVDKLRQLSMNIHEDLLRDEVTNPAKAVLFGNAFRLLPLAERSDPFTEKCHVAASSSSTALVFTPDLFFIVQYILDSNDSEYAALCRAAIFESTGRVSFPAIPVPKEKNVETQVDNEQPAQEKSVAE
jgi:hypothetical protein